MKCKTRKFALHGRCYWRPPEEEDTCFDTKFSLYQNRSTWSVIPKPYLVYLDQHKRHIVVNDDVWGYERSKPVRVPLTMSCRIENVESVKIDDRHGDDGGNIVITCADRKRKIVLYKTGFYN